MFVDSLVEECFKVGTEKVREWIPLRRILRWLRCSKIVNPDGISNLDSPKVSQTFSRVEVEASLPVKAHRKRLSLEVDPVVARALFSQRVGIFKAPQRVPPRVQLATDDSKFPDLRAGLESSHAELKGLSVQFAPVLFVAEADVFDGVVPETEQCLVAHHAVLQLLTGRQLESAEDETGVKISNFVTLLAEEIHLGKFDYCQTDPSRCTNVQFYF